MCMPAMMSGGNVLQALGVGSLVRPIAKPFFAHNGMDGINKAIYGGSGKSKEAPKANPLEIKDPNKLATPLGTRVGSGYTSAGGYNGLQV